MLKGSNKLVLNTATMLEIIQYYLNNYMLHPDKKSPKVTAFRSTGEPSPMYEVSLENETK